MSEAPKILEQMMAMWNERDLEKVRGYIDEIFSRMYYLSTPETRLLDMTRLR